MQRRNFLKNSSAIAAGLSSTPLLTSSRDTRVSKTVVPNTPKTICPIVIRTQNFMNEGREGFQIGFMAINKKGETGGYCIHPGFSYRTYSKEGHVDNPSKSYLT